MSGSSTQQYCLRWNNYQNNLTNVFDQLLQSEAFVDVTLACDSHSLKAHKMVLSACSPYFQTLFFDNPCKHPIVILKDVKWEELKAIVEFVYRGEINVSQEQLAPLLKVAELLKIRGLADVNRGTSNTSESEPLRSMTSIGQHLNGTGSKPVVSSRPIFGPILHNHGHTNKTTTSTTNESDRESPHGHLTSPQPHLSTTAFTHHPQPLRHSFTSSSSPNGHLRHTLIGLGRKRRKMSLDDDRTRSPPPTPPDVLDDNSNQLEIDSTNGDYVETTSQQSPIGILEPTTPTSGIGLGLVPRGPPSTTSINSIGSSMIGLHGPAGVSNTPTSTLSNVNEMDLKPGIVEMIREEERAKMLESSHGWLGSSAPLTLSDSYQYQIQSLWQKCWSTNQSGLHALRFRERGPLKSWRPETMAEAIFAVLREGLSLSQAARKFDIPYPTFVLYANRVHNMLGPSSDGSGGSDLLSDMRPKGRGRPQRILLGSWPEDHIRGVIRAVVFRDGGKEELPFVFSRDPSLNSQNGLDMTLHQQLNSMNPFLGIHQPQSSNSSCASPSGTPGPSKSPTDSTNESRETGLSHVQVELGHSSSSSTSSTPERHIRRKSSSGGGGGGIQHPIFSLAGSPQLLLPRQNPRFETPALLIDVDVGRKVSRSRTDSETIQIKSEIFEESDDDERHEKIQSSSLAEIGLNFGRKSPVGLNLALESIPNSNPLGTTNEESEGNNIPPSPKCVVTTLTH